MESTIPTDPSKIRKVAGVIPIDRSTNRILMVSSSSDPDKWVLPKGGIEEGESGAEAAAREAWEEGGIKGTIHPTLLGTWHGFKNKKKKGKVASTFEFYDMEVGHHAETWPEMENRKRSWFTVEEALTMVKHPYMREAILASPVIKSLAV